MKKPSIPHLFENEEQMSGRPGFVKSLVLRRFFLRLVAGYLFLCLMGAGGFLAERGIFQGLVRGEVSQHKAEGETAGLKVAESLYGSGFGEVLTGYSFYWPLAQDPVPGPAERPQEVETTLTGEQLEAFRQRLEAEWADRANRVFHHYVTSQQVFFKGGHQQALEEINKALALHENADLLAFKGTISFGMKNLEQARLFWRQALERDKDLPLPPAEGLEAWLKEEGLRP